MYRVGQDLYYFVDVVFFYKQNNLYMSLKTQCLKTYFTNKNETPILFVGLFVSCLKSVVYTYKIRFLFKQHITSTTLICFVQQH